MSIPTEQNNRLKTKEEDIINIKKIFQKFTDQWPLFLISILLCLGASYIYIISSSPSYKISALVLINGGDSGGSSPSSDAGLGEMGGLFGIKSSVDNESRVLKTRTLMEQVVREMQLNVVISQKRGLKTVELANPPFRLKLVRPLDTISNTTFTMEKSGNQMRLKGEKFEKSVKWNETFTISGVGVVQLTPAFSQSPTLNEEFMISIIPFDQKVAQLTNQLTVAVTSQKETVIEIGLIYPSQEKGEEILSTLIKRYIATNLEDKNEVADSTIKFIQGRLSYLGGELGGLEGNIQKFREQNNLADMSQQSKLLVENTGLYTNDLAKTEIQITILNELEQFLRKSSTNKRVLPSALLPTDAVYSGLIEKYNSLLMERDRLLLSVTEESAVVKNLNTQIENMRTDIIQNIASTKNTYLVTRNKLRSQISNSEGKIRGVPQTEKNYLVLARQQKIKEELYIFLMEKAEETAISKTSNVSVAKTIDAPKAELYPVSPKKNMVFLMAITIGIILPILYVIVNELSRTTVSSKEDITERTNAPIFGEIGHNESESNSIVANNSRSAIAEQFRGLRTKLSFFLKNADQKVLLFTSSISGEGKSFTAINLASILALTNKKVLLMEMDLRKPGLSSKLNMDNKKGFTNFMMDPTIPIKDLVQPVNGSSNLYLLSSGALPPNPAELLMDANSALLFSILKESFDYLIVDAPPIGIVTDAELLADFADVTLYLVRHKVTKKEHMEMIDELYQDRKFKNMGIIVNDISSKNYGSSYGYGYGYGSEELRPGNNLIKKIKQKFK